jgi:DNA-binding winged helix-turn-helix (wHTH) protein/TolB-like protein
MNDVTPPSSPRFRFSTFELDPRTGELRRKGLRTPLPDQPFLLLMALLEHPGELVTRDDLRQRLWRDETFVDFEHGLNAVVRRLRELLGDSAETPRFVETVPRRGYRFIAPVSGGADENAVGVEGAAPVVEPSRHRRRWLEWGRLCRVSVGLLAGGGVFSASASLVGSVTAPGALDGIHSVAVLPLRNLTGRPSDDYLADGITATVAATLSQASLTVLSSTTASRYKTTGRSAHEIADEVGVDAIAEGAVLQSGTRLRVTIALAQTRSQRRVWTVTCEGEAGELLRLHADIAHAVAMAMTRR